MVLKCLQNFKGELAGHVTKDSWPESSDFWFLCWACTRILTTQVKLDTVLLELFIATPCEAVKGQQYKQNLKWFTQRTKILLGGIEMSAKFWRDVTKDSFLILVLSLHRNTYFAGKIRYSFKMKVRMHLWGLGRGKMKPINDRVSWPAPQTKLNFGLSPSVKQHQNLCSRPPPA